MARTADLVIIMLDATKAEIHRQLLEAELEAVGIRLNKQKPNIYFKVRRLTRSQQKRLLSYSLHGFNAEYTDVCTLLKLYQSSGTTGINCFFWMPLKIIWIAYSDLLSLLIVGQVKLESIPVKH